jgi:hypothetical protein
MISGKAGRNSWGAQPKPDNPGNSLVEVAGDPHHPASTRLDKIGTFWGVGSGDRGGVVVVMMMSRRGGAAEIGGVCSCYP